MSSAIRNFISSFLCLLHIKSRLKQNKIPKKKECIFEVNGMDQRSYDLDSNAFKMKSHISEIK